MEILSVFFLRILPFTPLLSILVVAYLIDKFRDKFIIKSRTRTIKTKYKEIYSTINKEIKNIENSLRKDKGIIMQKGGLQQKIQVLKEKVRNLKLKEIEEIEMAMQQINL